MPQVRRSVEPNALWEFRSQAVGVQKGADESACASFAFGPRAMDDVQEPEIAVLEGSVNYLNSWNYTRS